MSARIKKEHRFSSATASALVVFIIIIAALMFYAGSLTIGQTETIAITTITDPTTLTTTSVSTVLSNVYVTVTRTNYTTVSYVGPDSVTVSGTASTTGLGTSATEVIFQGDGNRTFIAQVQGGTYSLSLPNHHFYSIYIKGTTVAGGLGASQCSAGGLVLFFTGTSITANWRC